MIFKTNLLLLMLCALTPVLHARTQLPNEFAKIKGVGIQTQVYSTLNNGNLPGSWRDFIEYDPEFKSVIELKIGGTQIGDLYSFISEEDRVKFPKGELLLIRSAPTDWPAIWKHASPNIDSSQLTEKQRAEFKRLADREQPIRYLVYRNERGDLDSVWWFEEDVQKMLAETGIRIPAPEPYQAPEGKAKEALAQSSITETTSEPVTVQSAVKEHPEVTSVEVIEEASEESSNWLLWLVGVLVVLGGLALVVRRKD